MFDEKDLAQYRSVLPSDEVKDRILADLDQGINGKKTGKINLSRAFPLIAACLVLVLSAVFLFGTAQSSLLLESQEGVTSARSIGETVTAKAEMKLPTHLSVSEGHLVVSDADTGKVLGQGTNLRVHGNVIVCWHLEEDGQKGEITLSVLSLKASYKAENGHLIRTK